ncbi:MAG: hypothetical protein Q9227_002207 [Pyrenula ochraceoflavens]
MQTCASSSLRHVSRGALPRLRSSQRRWAQVHDIRFVTTHRNPDAIQEKYQTKLEHKARQEGHQSVSSLKKAYREKISELRQSATTPTPTPQNAQRPPSPQPPRHATDSRSSDSSQPKTGIKPLSSYLDLGKIQTLPEKEIEVLWRLRHASDPSSLCATIPLDTYNRISKTAQQHPQFILPLPRQTDSQATDSQTANTAADIHFLQWAFHPPASPSALNTHTSTVLFTHLASYKLHGAYAQPHTTLTHHLDLADSHGIVLLRGQVVPDRGVSVEEGRWLVMCLQRFYDFEVQGGQNKGKLLKSFSEGRGGEDGFKVEALMEEAEKLG